jgi:uncharacterized protein (TIGR03000 family)
MYSMVLMAALTTGSAAPDCHHSYSACSCAWYGGCYGGCSCSGWGGCHGCWGSGWGCHGCYGAYSWSSCYGCYGSWACHGCYGCYGCWGYGCYSAWGCSGCYGGVYVAPAGSAAPQMNPPSGDQELPPPKQTKPKSKESTRASLTVQLPADAKLFVDGQATRTTSATRHFVTPPLLPGQAYFYDLRAEVVREGQTVSLSRRVVVRPGESVNTSFTELQGSATARSRD